MVWFGRDDVSAFSFGAKAKGHGAHVRKFLATILARLLMLSLVRDRYELASCINWIMKSIILCLYMVSKWELVTRKLMS